ncbi:MAG: hypothetical protein QG597_4672, partial [Actinomycetota bacterium]|nr:hypothetical protein [Actinomycetota bacterium]
MSEPFDIAAAKTWLDALPGGQIGERLAERWQRFACIDAPVVTIYGSYDTGKSSLLRRVLIEVGQAVPSWLTISARNETFEVNEIRAAGCVLRDTPGFVVEGADARAEMNTELASEAIVLTDVAIVTVPPQLVTAEYPVLRALVEQDWTPDSLWFVISRFDEAGADPDDDLDSYRKLAERKTAELRTALNLDDEVPVHVVCSDFAQMAGAEQNPDPEVWDESREWDGIAGLVEAITVLGTSHNSALRRAAEQRYWRNAVQQALFRLPQELEKRLDNAVVSDEGDQLRASWLAQLDTVDRAAEADLRGRVSAAINDAMDSPDPTYGFAERLKTSVGAWHSASERDVDKLLRSVGETLATDRTRPDWQRFDDLAAALRREPSKPESECGHSLLYAPVVGEVGDAILDALRHYQDSRGLKQAAPTSQTSGADPMAAAAAGIALATQLATIAEGFRNRQRTTARERTDIQSGLVAVGGEATALANDELNRLVGAARQQIINA